MLERQWSAAAGQQNLYGPGGDSEFIGFADITSFVRQRIFLIMAFPLLGLLGAGFSLATTDSIFTARTQILIEPKIPELLQRQSGEINLSLDTSQVETQLAVLRSEKIALMVIEELDLVDNPRFKSVSSPSMVERVGRIKEMVVDMLALDGDPQHQAMPKPASPIADRSETKAVIAQLSEFERRRIVVETFRESLGVQRVGVSYAIDITFQSHDPALAAKVANATAAAFVREQLETRAAAAREGVAWLEKRIEEVRTQMNLATQVTQEFRAKHDYSVGRQLGATIVDGEVVASGQGEGITRNGPTLEELEVTADTYRKMYESLLAAFTSSVNQQPYLIADARVITPATRPLAASHPRKKFVLALGGLSGLMAGFGLAFARHTLDRTIRTSRQVRDELGFDCVGELPPVGFLRGFGQLDDVLRRPESLFSRNLRHTKGAISLADVAHPLRCIGVTSATPDDGKSTVASNLAALYAVSGMRTLVIDADGFHSTLTKRLPHSQAPAGENRDGAEIEGQITSVPGLQFDLLPSPASDTLRLITPKNLEALLVNELDSYEIIIVDLPPFTSGVHGLVAASVLDGVLIVAEWGKTPLDLVGELSRILRITKTAVIGVVMTKVRSLSTRQYRKRATQTGH
ncbi:polysaccharide biosynthesis tyrosine autokinase [Sinorhizobium meliloti]|uniref:polysaccharide biosynthesis tyrosine autokinase n=1 Tax=Rhizobium meliloti TaxID=382 RepID=UPI000406D621|nr:polysaccharide biosynthesis tyrosine autokinase [Sinorhizobium meliloti]MDE3832833.1 polysaccharide biosynthesis tyrosine autokinase [Sinorhizobium meliloti]MDE4581496.1 polysaccharide biosynthesis tyrosine autokinase [Sinorhizobium meliloti]MDX0157676.1 ATPase [Sinorhizobium meliloti]